MKIAPEHTAVRVALWRALHIALDSKPHVFSDELGEKIVAEENWRNRPDMNPDFSKPMRASIVARARFIEDVVEAEFKQGVTQYVILGAGLDTFAQRRVELSSRMQIFEVDQAGPQAWKQVRLKDLGIKSPEGLHFVPVDFEAGESWWDRLISSGFDQTKPAVVVSTGVGLNLHKMNYSNQKRTESYDKELTSIDKTTVHYKYSITQEGKLNIWFDMDLKLLSR